MKRPLISQYTREAMRNDIGYNTYIHMNIIEPCRQCRDIDRMAYRALHPVLKWIEKNTAKGAAILIAMMAAISLGVIVIYISWALT